MPFAAIWMHLEITILNKVRKLNIIGYHLFVESKKCYKSTYLQNGNRLRGRKETYSYQKGKGMGEG